MPQSVRKRKSGLNSFKQTYRRRCPMRLETIQPARWAALTNGKGIGLPAIGQPFLSVNALHYGTEDLNAGKHASILSRAVMKQASAILKEVPNNENVEPQDHHQ